MAKDETIQLKNFYEQISQYAHPEGLFGDLGAEPSQQLDRLEAAFKTLIKQYHPDRYARQPENLAFVTEITKCLNELKRRAANKIKSGVYGDLSIGDYSSSLKTSLHEYFVTHLLVEGRHADIYHGYFLNPAHTLHPKTDVVIKIIADPSQNSLIEQEVMFYQTMEHFCFPKYIENICTPDGRRAIVLERVADGYDLIELGQRYRARYHTPGLPQEHMVWMLDRFLSALGLMHEQRVLHGNIQPDNLMVQPLTHNGLLIDFLHCRISPVPDEVFSIVNPTYCAPEVLTRHFKPHPVSDIYALGSCMLELLGGSVNGLDDSIDLHPSLRTFLSKMVHRDPAQRASDAWALAGELKSLREKIYGAHRFFPLEI